MRGRRSRWSGSGRPHRQGPCRPWTPRRVTSRPPESPRPRPDRLLPPGAPGPARGRDPHGRLLPHLVRPGLGRGGHLPAHLRVPADRLLRPQARTGTASGCSAVLGACLQTPRPAGGSGHRPDDGREPAGPVPHAVEGRPGRGDRLAHVHRELVAGPAERGLLRGRPLDGEPPSALLVPVDPGSGVRAVAPDLPRGGAARPAVRLACAPDPAHRVRRDHGRLLRVERPPDGHAPVVRLLRHPDPSVGVLARVGPGTRLARPREEAGVPRLRGSDARQREGGARRHRMGGSGSRTGLRMARRRPGGLPGLDRAVAAAVRVDGHHGGADGPALGSGPPPRRPCGALGGGHLLRPVPRALAAADPDPRGPGRRAPERSPGRRRGPRLDRPGLGDHAVGRHPCALLEEAGAALVAGARGHRRVFAPW